MNSLQMIESILTEGHISSTYKYALLTSIIDYVIEDPLQTPINNFHFIPIFVLARQFLGYYFPLVLDKVRQGSDRRSETGIALEKHVEEFISRASETGKIHFSLREPENTYKLFTMIEETEELSKELLSLLFNIRRIILDQPIRYVNNIRGKKISLFGVFAKSIPFQETFEIHLEQGLKLPKREILKCRNWEEMLEKENCSIFIGHQTYYELSRFRFLLRDVVLKRWAEVTFGRYKCKNHNILEYFDLWKSPIERDVYSVQRYKKLYQEIGLKRCVYCGKTIEGADYHLDHLIPWSRMPINRFWNLYPACKSCNTKKSDRIPILDEHLIPNIKNHLRLCIGMLHTEEELIARDLKQLYIKTFNSQYKVSNITQMTEEIVEYLKNLSTNILELIPEHVFIIS